MGRLVMRVVSAAALGCAVQAFADGAGGVVTNEMPDGSTLYTIVW